MCEMAECGHLETFACAAGIAPKQSFAVMVLPREFISAASTNGAQAQAITSQVATISLYSQSGLVSSANHLGSLRNAEPAEGSIAQKALLASPQAGESRIESFR
jgi:hypothetical protein